MRALIRIPHQIFFDYPFVWQSINTALVVFLVLRLARRTGLSRGTSIGASVSISISGNLLLFADTSEDVLFVAGLILLLLLAVASARPVVIGLRDSELLADLPNDKASTVALTDHYIVLQIR